MKRSSVAISLYSFSHFVSIKSILFNFSLSLSLSLLMYASGKFLPFLTQVNRTKDFLELRTNCVQLNGEKERNIRNQSINFVPRHLFLHSSSFLYWINQTKLHASSNTRDAFVHTHTYRLHIHLNYFPRPTRLSTNTSRHPQLPSYPLTYD